jgi:hypothetical protein
VRYGYYANLNARDKATYRRSDEVAQIALDDPEALAPLVRALEAALEAGRRPSILRAAQRLANGLLADLAVPLVKIKVLAARPSTTASELHGLYEPAERREPAVITVWTRTAYHKRVVAFRTFLRTLLHELCHHLDYELLELADSFHTEGFFKRESSLFNQLVAKPPRPARRRAAR